MAYSYYHHFSGNEIESQKGQIIWAKWSESESHSVMSDSLRPHGYTVHGILQARILEWVAFSFSRVSSQPRDRTQVSDITGRFFTSWATREAQFEQNHTEILGLRFMPTASSTNCADVFFLVLFVPSVK